MIPSGMKRNQKQLSGVNPAEITAAYIRILFWFFAFPGRDFTFNEICEATNTSKTTARAVIEELKKKHLIIKTVLGKLWRLASNFDSPNFRHAKIAYNLDLIYESGIVNEILKIYPQARAIVLFGSFRKGEDIETSDLDIAVDVPGTRQLKVEPIGTINLGYRAGTAVKLHIFSRENIDLNVFSNMANGIVLHGFLEVRP
jgi:predicted nucleotidyltransferase